MKKLLRTLTITLLLTATLAACGAEDENNQDLLVDFSEPLPAAAAENSLPPLATPIPTQPPPEPEPAPSAAPTEPTASGTDTFARIETALATIQFDISDLDAALQDLRRDVDEIDSRQSTEKEELLNEIEIELSNLTHQYITELESQIAELVQVKIEQEETIYRDTVDELKAAVREHTEAYTAAVEKWPAPDVRFQPFQQTAINRSQTELEWVLQPYPNGLPLASHGQAFVFNLDSNDTGKVVGFKRLEGADEGRGIIPGYVPHMFPSEVYRASHYTDVRFYEPNSEKETTLNTANGQGIHYKPRLPAHVDCSKIILFVSEWQNGTWKDWQQEADGCSPNGVNIGGRYIVAVALDQQR